MGYTRPRLFKRWIALSTGSITIQRISITQINYAICWIVIYPVDSAIQRLNNPGQELDIGMMYWNNAHSLLFSISPQPPNSLQATSCNLLFSLSLSLEQAIQNGVFNFLPTWQKIGKKFEKISVPIYCWHTLIVWLMGLSISELVDKWTLKKWITGFVAGPSGSSVVQYYPWGKSISSRSVLDNPTALSTE